MVSGVGLMFENDPSQLWPAPQIPRSSRGMTALGVSRGPGLTKTTNSIFPHPCAQQLVRDGDFVGDHEAAVFISHFAAG